MKKQLLKLGAACLALTIGATAMGQTQQTATILNIGSAAVTVDGVADGVWANVDPVSITTIFTGEAPSIESTWKMLWSADGVYIIVESTDDVWASAAETGLAQWQSDHIELYFDVSDPQIDGGGPANGDQKALGNHQVAPEMPVTSGELVTGADGVLSASVFDQEGARTKEFYVPFSAIPQSGNTINPEVMDVIGFDVTVIDNDAPADELGRKRISWSNDGSVAESWNNCDAVGLITFSADEVPNAVKQNVAKMDVTVVNGQLTFDAKVSNVTVLNSIGQVVAKSANVSTLPKGVYVVTAKTAKGDAASKFVIK